MSTVQTWSGDDVEVHLAADFDSNLSGLGLELGTENYDMSAPLHSLIQSVNPEYHEVNENGIFLKYIFLFPSDSSSRENPFPFMEPIRNSYSTQAKKTRLALSAEEDASSTIKRFCTSSEDKENTDSSQGSRCRHSSSVPDLRTTGSPSVTAVSVLSPSMLSQMLQISDPSPPFIIRDLSPNLKNTGFQYVLGAATSIATKVNEETMTYLNQAEKIRRFDRNEGKLLKSIIRVGFQERRLQYSEKEQIAQWQSHRVGERILEIDVPFSYGLYDVKNDPNNIHICEFLWDPTAESGVFVKLNCISTEFTPKKHGGEKGAPFRIQIETFSDSENYTHRLHVASCQVKVFKPKGADRKHKTDREKMSKRPQAEQEKYKTSYDCTVFSECAADSLYVTTSSSSTASPSTSVTNSRPGPCFSPKISNPENKTIHAPSLQNSKYERSKSESLDHSDVSCHSQEKSPSSDNFELCSDDLDSLTIDSTKSEASNWLIKNMFLNFIETFSNYNGLDMLRLSQDDCIKICGLTDGVRLYNSLHCRPVLAKKAIFARLPHEEVFRAVYLHELTVAYLTAKLSMLFHIPIEKIQELQLRIGASANYAVTDEVVINIPDQSLFILDILLPSQSADKYILLLKPINEL
ncbi:transcription factor CP2 [Caerostris extrusa]|uniref:Transcription factor CP2 n=1 Tax=Caerostris extrusa TaxID=172846 RepID=A0AAV4N3C1_CAEEX|nr:transcription factor CP2 [Caerostris extrusa]